MKLKKISNISALGNSLVAFIYISFLLVVWLEKNSDFFVVYPIGIASAYLIGKFKYRWYLVLPNDKWDIAPYFVSSLISFPSAILASFVYIIYKGSDLPFIQLVMASIFIGTMAALLSLPASLSAGGALTYLIRCKQNSNKLKHLGASQSDAPV